MRLVVKVGGTMLEEAAAREGIAHELTEIAREHELTIVHGGGKQMTRFLEERGIASQFVNGLRVSDDAVIDAVTHVIAGSVNKRLVATIIGAGGRAVGISGVDGGLTIARELDTSLGAVGRPERTDERLLSLLVEAGYTPVVACIAADERGNIYNVNADQMAVSCATGWHADKLFFLTDVAGVRDASGRLAERLGSAEIDDLIATGVAAGGMQAKLEAARAGLKAGIGEVVIAHGREAQICRRLILGEQIGTRLSRESVRVEAVIPEKRVTA